MNLSLIISAFLAGILTFLAPCTFPLVPGYLGFISGISLEDVKDSKKLKRARWKIFLNGVFFVMGFSVVFIVLGASAGLLGQSLIRYRLLLIRIGGVFMIIFGLFMMGILNIPFLNKERKLRIPKIFDRGNLVSSFLLGTVFGFGWTPCVGPILGSILTLAAFSTTAIQGSLLLMVFSLGLAIPFLVIALAIGWASKHLIKISKYLHIISFISGAFILLFGILFVTNSLNLWISYAYQLFRFINYDKLINYL